MKIKLRFNLKLEDAIRTLIAILIILISGTAVYSIEEFAMLRSVTLVLLLGCLLHEFIRRCNIKRKKLLVFVLLTILFFTIVLFRSSGETFGVISKILLVIFLTNYCYKSNNSYELLKIIYKFIIVVSIIALLFFVLLFVCKVDLPSTNVGDGFYKSYFYVFFTQFGYVENIGGFSFYRMQSIFWEPGVFSVYLLLSLYFYCFLAKEKKAIYFFILTASLILTLSTTGLIVGIGLIAVYFLKKMKSIMARILTVGPICIIAVPVAVNLWMQKKNSTISPSYRLRMYDMARSLEIWKDNFLLGVGYNNTSLFELEGRTGNSNGFLNWCMTTGVLGLAFVILPFVINCIISKSEERVKYIVFLGLFVLINYTEPLIQTPIMLLLISMSYVAMIEKRGLVDDSQKKTLPSYLP